MLGGSKGLSGLLNESIKLKSGKPLVASSFLTRIQGLLIKLQMECEGQPLIAIIDTGSQLNVVSKVAWKEVIQRLMDLAKSLSMNDANGGEGVLRGLVQHMPLSCGQVLTQANLYVGEHVPFQLLLGRPWQSGNYVSIDGRNILVFKDPGSLEAHYKVLVHQDNQTICVISTQHCLTVPITPENLLLTVSSEMEINRSRDTAAKFQIRKGSYPIGRIWNMIFLSLWRIIVILFLGMVVILQWVNIGTAKILERVQDTEEEPENRDLNERIHEFCD